MLIDSKDEHITTIQEIFLRKGETLELQPDDPPSISESKVDLSQISPLDGDPLFSPNLPPTELIGNLDAILGKENNEVLDIQAYPF